MTNIYYREEFLEIRKKYADIVDFLEKKQSKLEYIDSIESENFFISKDLFIHVIKKNILIVNYIQV